jgi:signal peptidase II
MKRSFILMSLAALLVLLLDQITKALISGGMTLGTNIPVVEGFARLRYTHNTGAAFGLFADSTSVLSIVSPLVIIGILVAFVRVGDQSTLSVLSAGLIVGGAIGNLADRIRLGYVVDFVEVYGPHLKINDTVYTFPVFNVADSAITIGVILILAGLLFGKIGQASPTRNNTPVPSGDTNSPNETDSDAKSASLAGR